MIKRILTTVGHFGFWIAFVCNLCLAVVLLGIFFGWAVTSPTVILGALIALICNVLFGTGLMIYTGIVAIYQAITTP